MTPPARHLKVGDKVHHLPSWTNPRLVYEVTKLGWLYTPGKTHEQLVQLTHHGDDYWVNAKNLELVPEKVMITDLQKEIDGLKARIKELEKKHVYTVTG